MTITSTSSGASGGSSSSTGRADSSNKSTNHTGAIVGGAVGGSVGALLVLGLLLWWLCARRDRQDPADIRWPELKGGENDLSGAALQPLPVHRTGGAGFDMGEDSENELEDGPEGAAQATSAGVAATTAPATADAALGRPPSSAISHPYHQRSSDPFTDYGSGGVNSGDYYASPVGGEQATSSHGGHASSGVSAGYGAAGIGAGGAGLAPPIGMYDAQTYSQPYDQPYDQPYSQPYNQPYDQPHDQPYDQAAPGTAAAATAATTEAGQADYYPSAPPMLTTQQQQHAAYEGYTMPHFMNPQYPPADGRIFTDPYGRAA